MSEPKDFNATRVARAQSERRFYLGPYTFKRRAAVPAEVLARYSTAGQSGDDRETIRIFEEVLIELVEPTVLITGTSEYVSTEDAWQILKTEGDENDVVDFFDLADVLKWLVEGITERPTGQPSDSADGSSIPQGGTTSTGISLPEASMSISSMPAAS